MLFRSSGLNKGEVEKMVTDAKSHEAEDKQKREVADTRNRAEQLAYQMEKLISENKAKLGAESIKAVEEGIAEVNKIKTSEDLAVIKAAMEKLEKASHAAAAELYKTVEQPGGTTGGGPTPPGAPGAGPGSQATPEGEKKKDDVVDAEFRPS